MVNSLRSALVLVHALIFMADGFCQNAPGVDRDVLDEVVVEGARRKLGELRRELVQLEDRFYRRYNAINSIDKFDVHCKDELRTGTRVKRRYCRAVYAAKEQRVEAQAYFFNLQRIMDESESYPAGSTAPPVPAIMSIEAQRPAFRQNLKRVVGESEELLALLRERLAVLQQFEALQARASGKRVPIRDEQWLPAPIESSSP